MEFAEFKETLQKEAKKIKVIVTDEKAEKLYNYMLSLLEWNKKINLTAITEPNDVILKHFVDSFTIHDYIKKDAKMIDVGTGAGFPGVPLAILRDDIRVTLIDSLQKRINFLNEVIATLGLQNVEAIHTRAEDLAQNEKYREQYDVVTSRAVANMSTLLEYMLPFSKVEGVCVCMKGSNVEEELASAEKAARVLGGRLEKREEFFLSNQDNKRNIIIIRKISNTPKQYPRGQGKPAKMPIS